MRIRLATLIITLVVLLISISEAEAQSWEQPTWLNFYFGHHQYDGDLGNEMLEFQVGEDWTGGIGIGQYLNEYLDLELSAIYGRFTYKNFTIQDNPLKSRTSFVRNFISADALLKFMILREPAYVRPFVGTGIGVTRIFGGNTSVITSFNPREVRRLPSERTKIFAQLPLQLGVDVKITRNINATLNATYHRTFSDGIEGRGGEFDIDGKNHDDFINYAVGIKFSLNKTNDSDGDGIPNRNDLCPNSFGKSFWGCPDSDGDGIVDNEDACPGEAGGSALNGCPDSDRDGIENSRDECPNEAGSIANNGCPVESDTDSDGITDDEDACPNSPGDISNNGCPEDADGDGIANIDDRCPQVAGVATNDGCPEKKELDENVKVDLQNIIESLQFTISSSNIDPSSFDELDRLAQIMNDDQELRLIIRGHTDNTGNSNTNLELSVDRANSVKQYLVDKGVQARRIAAFGYGETRPVASNDTPEGRLQNRRVELDLYYQ